MKRAVLLLLLLPGLLTCTDDRLSGPSGPGEPRFDISDATHGDLALRNPGFFLLPPVGAQPDASVLGTFEPGLSLIVRLQCFESTQITCPTTPIATFTIGSGLVVGSDHYHANVDTRGLQTSSSDGSSYTTYRVEVWTPPVPEFGGSQGFLFGFADFQLGETGNEAKNLSTGGMIGLVDGRTLPFKFYVNKEALGHELKANTAGAGTGALCQINCSVTVIQPGVTTEASLSKNGVEQTAMLFQPGDVSETKVLVIDERVEEGPGVNCAPSTTVEKRNCFRYAISPDREPPNPPDFNNPVRFGICAFGVPLGPGTFWRILEVDDNGFVNRPPEADVSDFLPCTSSSSLALSGGPLGRLASAALNWLVPPLHAAGDTEHHGGTLQDLSDLFWAQDAEMSALTAGGTVPAGTSVAATVQAKATHPEPDAPLSGAEVNFLITAGTGSIAAPAGATVVGTPTSTSVTLLTGPDGKATVNLTVAVGTNTLQATSPDALTADGNPLTFTITGDQIGITFETLADGSSIVGKTPFTVSNQLASLGATFSATQGGTPTICTDPFNSSNHVIAVRSSDPCSPESDEGKSLDIKFTAPTTTVEFDEIVPAGKGSPFVCHPSGSTAVASVKDFGAFRVVHWKITHPTAPIEEICVGAATDERIWVDNIKAARPAQLIAFRSDRDGVCCSAGEIYVMKADGTNPVRLTTNQAIDEQPAWSPDGKRIAFVSNRDGNREIYVMNADGTSQFRLTNNPADDMLPTWHPDGTKILFTSNRDGNSEVYVMNANGTNPVNLTNNPANDFGPAFSPDGSKLAFYSNRDGNFEIYAIVNGVPVRLTNNAADDVLPTWSPDGAKIAFVSGRDGNREIYVMNADGSSPMRLTTNAGSDDEPSWSPEGTRIVFRSVRSDGTSGLYVMNANGSNPVRLTGSAVHDQDPDWWP